MATTDPKSAYETRQALHAELAAVTDALIAEHAGRVPAGAVIRCVARAREHLLRSGLRAGLAAAVESMARVQLRTMHAPARLHDASRS